MTTPRQISFIFLSGLLLGILSACNLPVAPAELSLEEQAGTLAAQTIAANETQQTVKTPTLANTATQSPPTATITPTYSLPLLKIDENTHCRSGPGQDYEIITTYKAGATVEIVGKHPTSSYWVVKNHNGKGTCWIWSEFTSATGSHWTVPTMTPPPTKTPSPPAAPTLKNYDFSCAWNGNNNDLSIVIQWNDKANNETGYRIYRSGTMLVDLGANTTAYTDVFAVDSGQAVNYAIEAYNLAGNSGQLTLSATCQ